MKTKSKREEAHKTMIGKYGRNIQRIIIKAALGLDLKKGEKAAFTRQMSIKG